MIMKSNTHDLGVWFSFSVFKTLSNSFCISGERLSLPLQWKNVWKIVNVFFFVDRHRINLSKLLLKLNRPSTKLAGYGDRRKAQANSTSSQKDSHAKRKEYLHQPDKGAQMGCQAESPTPARSISVIWRSAVCISGCNGDRCNMSKFRNVEFMSGGGGKVKNVKICYRAAIPKLNRSLLSFSQYRAE